MLMLLCMHVTRVLFLVLAGNFALTMGFYWSYTLLPVLMHSWFVRSVYSHLWFIVWDHHVTLSYSVSLCVTVLTNCLVNPLCYTVLCRITSGPFDQEVISSSLTLEDPDLKVRETTNLVSMATGLSSQIGKCDKKRPSNTRLSFLRGRDL